MENFNFSQTAAIFNEGREAMKLSEVLKEFKVVDQFDIKNEKEFETLALVESNPEKGYCTFIADEQYIPLISDNVKMIITDKGLADRFDCKDTGICVVENPRNAFFKLHNALGQSEKYIRKQFKTKIGENCNISSLAVIAENNVVIGDNVTIEEFVVIRENTTIGDNCIIRAGVKLGGSDFEFKRENGKIFSVEHYGGLVLGRNVEVQYNTGINRALYPWDDTIIDDFTKVDMLVHIAHGVKIGKSGMIVANSGIGGRVEIGNEVWIGFAATIKNGIHIGDKARVNMGAVVTKDVESEGSVTGNFAVEHSRFIANMKAQVQ